MVAGNGTGICLVKWMTGFYRGARPKAEDYQALAELGVKTIIDLTDNSREYEQPAVEAAGLRYVNIPMVDKSYPSMEQVNEFLKVVEDPATGKFFLHCAGAAIARE